MLVVGTLLAPGRRTVTATRRVLGLEHTRRFERYHRVLNRAHWSGLAASRVLRGCPRRLGAHHGADLLRGEQANIVARWHPADSHGGRPAIAHEAYLSDPLVRPARHDRLTGGVTGRISTRGRV